MVKLQNRMELISHFYFHRKIAGTLSFKLISSNGFILQGIAVSKVDFILNISQHKKLTMVYADVFFFIKRTISLSILTSMANLVLKMLKTNV